MTTPETPRTNPAPAEGEFLAAQPDVVERLREDLPDDEVLYDLAELFRMFADSTRIKILYALFESELCVGDIAQLSEPVPEFGESSAAAAEKQQAGRSSAGRARSSFTRWTTTTSAA